MALRADLSLGHYGLWKGGVHHRDISAANLMYYWLEGKAIGVVNDFDLATLAGCERKFGDERTGTIPFMAMELLQKEGQGGTLLHRYGHEIESFIWVFLWVSCQCSETDGTLREGFLADLGKVCASECAEKKANFITIDPHLPEDVDGIRETIAWKCINFLFDQTYKRGKDSMSLKQCLTKLGRTDGSTSTAGDIKEEIAELRGKLYDEDVDEVFREFAAKILLPDFEVKVERAAKGTSLIQLRAPRIDSE